MTVSGKKIFPVIMAGGASSRLWPASGPERPKWDLRLFGGRTLLEDAWERARAVASAENCYVVSGGAQGETARRTLPELPAENLLLEPEPRDTAGAVAFAAGKVSARTADGLMLVLPGDHLISPLEEFGRCVAVGAEAAATAGRLVTLGIHPTAPATAYGYIHRGAPLPCESAVGEEMPRVFRVLAFKEKPDETTAESYVASGAYDWNGGIFLWRADSLLKELKRQMPLHAEMSEKLAAAANSAEWAATAREYYSRLPKKSIDYGVMENAREVAVVSATFDWDDIGSWSAVRDHLPKIDTAADEDGGKEAGAEIPVEQNAAPKDTVVLARNAGGNIVWAPGRTVALIGVENLAVVEGPDGILVCALSKDQSVKEISRAAAELKRESGGRRPAEKGGDA